MIDAPTLRLAGAVISGAWARDRPTVLADVRIQWGRSSLYDPAEPATLSVEILDPGGTLAGADLAGQRITLHRSDNVCIFRGSVNDHEATLVRVADPETGRPMDAWRVKISAADVLAELAQAILPGPGGNAEISKELGPRYYPTQSPQERLDAIRAAGAWMIVNSIEWTNPYGFGSYYPLVRFREWELSALEMIELVYDSYPLAWVRFVPGENRIRIGRPAVMEGIELELASDGKTIRLNIPNGHEVAASRVMVPGGEFTARTTIDKGIGAVQVKVPQLGPGTGYEIVETTTEVLTDHAAGDRGGRKVYAVENDVFYNDPADGRAAAWQQLLAEDAAGMVNQLNGALELPVVRFDFKRFPMTDTFAIARLLDSGPFPAPFYFPGSVFAGLQRAGAGYQPIGGEISWVADADQGHWISDVRLAPALGHGASLALSQLVTIPGPALEDFHPELTLADLGNVTKGLTA